MPRPSFFRPPRLGLALQGGGAHGAFTWGVLDRLLQDEHLEITAMSGASAGALNGVTLAAGLLAGDRANARQKLAHLWDAVTRTALPEMLKGFARISTMQVLSHLSPYEFNPLGLDPLRALLAAHVDFAALRAGSPFPLIITATDVATGQPRLFREHELTIDMVLASACLPALQRAVMIDGRAYWDGGFSANPDIVTLAATARADARDTLVVLLNPLDRGTLPFRAREIAGHVSDLTFNQSFLRDCRTIAEVKALGRLATWMGPKSWRAIRRHRFHMVTSEEHARVLPTLGKGAPEPEIVKRLFEAGRIEADVWLVSHRDAVGRRATVDVAKVSGFRSQDLGNKGLRPQDPTPENYLSPET